jgi:uncharacterized membrane protein YgcG
MKVSLKNFGRGLCFVLMLALGVSGVSAQQSANGSLRGQISDEFGGVIVGATVTVVDAAGKQRTATTDSDGGFAVAGLAPGKYIVRAVAVGFAFYENAEVNVQPGRNEPLKITLGVSLDKEEVTVASEGPINIDNSSAGAVVLKGKDIEALPDDPDELAAALSALAGPAAGPNGGQILIDGFEGGRIPPKDSIREIRINDNPLAAENDRPGFGGIQIFTKPGTDKLRGSVSTTFNDESLNSRNPFLQQAKRPPFQYRQFGGNLSGTIVPKKSSFFLDFERGETDDNDLVNATVLDPVTLQPLGFNAAVLTPARRFNFSPRVDYAFNDKHTLVARYSFFKNSQKNLGVSQFSLPERAFDSQSQSHQLQLTETAIVNPTTVNETRFQFIRSRNEQTALNDGLAINVLDAFSQGGAPVGNSFNESTRWELTNSTTKAHGLHSIKFGARLRGISISDFSENNFNGTFTFSSLDQYRAALLTTAIPTQLSIAGGEPLAKISQVDFGGFVQDDWKIRPNLTVGGGVRYEAQTNISSKFNFAPRVYFAWSPDTTPQKQGKTAIRLGFGVFYDRVGENMSLQALRFNGINQQQFVITAPFADDTSARATQARAILGLFPIIPTTDQLTAFAVPQTTRQLADDIQAPYSYITGFILTRQLTKTMTLNVFASTYSTRHVIRSRNINAPISADGLRPQPELGNIFQFESSGTQNMKQLNIGLSKQFSRAISINANYTLSKAESDTDFGGFPVNQYDLTGEYGRTSFDTRHRLFIFGSLAIPYLKLSLNPMIIANTGRPFNITTGFDNNRDGIINDRPAFADAQTSAADLRRTSFGDFDINPKAGQTIIPRNFGEGPGFFSLNLRVGRTFAFGDLPGAAERRQAAKQQQQQDGQGGNRGGGNNRGGGGGGGARGGGGGAMMQPGMGGGMMVMMGAPGGGEQKRFSLNFSLNFTNLLNRTNLGNPVGNLSSANFGESLFSLGGGFGGGGNQAAGNRRIQASVRFGF